MCATRLSSIRWLYGIQDVRIIFQWRMACIGTFLYKVMEMLHQLVTAIEPMTLLYNCICNSVLCTCIFLLCLHLSRPMWFASYSIRVLFATDLVLYIFEISSGVMQFQPRGVWWGSLFGELNYKLTSPNPRIRCQLKIQYSTPWTYFMCINIVSVSRCISANIIMPLSLWQDPLRV